MRPLPIIHILKLRISEQELYKHSCVVCVLSLPKLGSLSELPIISNCEHSEAQTDFVV